MKTKRLSPENALDQIDFLELDQFLISSWPAKWTQKLSDLMEDWNWHSENCVLLACQVGTSEDIAEAKAILKGHRAEGFLSPENSRRRHALYSKLSAVTIETPEEKLIPPAVATVIVPRDLLEKLAIIALNLATVGHPITPEMIGAAQKTYRSIADQTLQILTPS